MFLSENIYGERTMKEYIVVFCTIASIEDAKRISNELVKSRMAACVNIINGMTSVYEWKGEICTENECLMVIKTKKELFNELKKEIISMHAYEIPEIISLDITDGLDSYLDWIFKNTK
jgi:periplasmic divalent cation tolerance protein